jgi:hypothetical protein
MLVGKAYNYERSQYAVGIDPSVSQTQLPLHVAVASITPTLYSWSPSPVVGPEP